MDRPPLSKPSCSGSHNGLDMVPERAQDRPRSQSREPVERDEEGKAVIDAALAEPTEKEPT